MAMFLWCSGGFLVVAWLCFYGGCAVFVVVSLWWLYCSVFVVVFLCFCGDVYAVVSLCFCGSGILVVVVFLRWCFCALW